MKKIIFLIAFALTAGISAQAQKKLGYVNSQELLSLMPEAKAADKTLDSFQKSLQDQYKALAEEGQKKFQEYQENEKTWSAAVKETKEKELNDLQSRMMEFQTAAEEKITSKKQEVFQPLLEKAQKAIKSVGEEGAYDYIFDGGALLYAKDSENLMPKVKAKLGIK